MTQTTGWPAPAPGAAPMPAMVAAQARLETRLLLRNGEQLLLTLIIPLLLLAGFSLGNAKVGGRPGVDFYVPGIIALAIMSTGFTSLAIATGFERRYGVLKRLGATPLSAGGMILAKTATVIAVEILQTALIIAVGAALGWRPHASPAAVVWVVLLVLVGTAAFSGLALTLAGLLRAEATLAAANFIYLILLGAGGILFRLSKFGAGAGALQLLPAGALSTGLRALLEYHQGFPLRDLAVLVAWAAVTITIAARTFRWE